MPPSWPALDDRLLTDAAATFNFRLGVPTALAITADGSVLFRRTPARDFAADLFELAPDGTVTTLLSATEQLAGGAEALSDAEKARRERTRTATRGVVDIDVSDDGKTVLVPLGGDLTLLHRGGAASTVLHPSGEAYDPHLAPDGSLVAFVRDGDLYVTGPQVPETRLTTHPDGFEYGVADFAAQEELARRRGFWWSPDSKSIVFQRSDTRLVDTLYVADARHPEKPPVPFKYPRAGTANAIVDLGVLEVAAALATPSAPTAPRWLTWDHAKYEYLAQVSWSEHGPLAVVLLDRDQTDATLLALDPATGAAATLVTEHDDAWVNVDAGGPTWLDDGSGFLWMTERPGAWTLELHGPDGSLVRALTAPELGLRALAGVDARGAIVEASPDPTRTDIYRIPFAGGAPERLGTADGVASVVVAKHGAVVIDSQLAAGGRQIEVVSAASRHTLPSVAERPSLVPTTVLETVELGGRTHHVAITRPRTFAAGRKYPVLLKVYGGPHAQMVEAARDGYVMDQWYADAGFIVVRSDGRGTPARGRAWERAILRDLITIPLADQIDALQAVGARYPELDLARVGVTGWSFGGYFSAMAVLLRPDVFAAGVAGAPVTDWSLYDTAYTERYMKTPTENPAGYASTSALTHAAKLTRPLLVIHGITDDNVHFAHTLAFIEALYVAGKRAEVITLSATHMVPDPKLNLAREQTQIDFFRTHL